MEWKLLIVKRHARPLILEFICVVFFIGTMLCELCCTAASDYQAALTHCYSKLSLYWDRPDISDGCNMHLPLKLKGVI